MAIEVRVSRGYAWRMIIIAVVCLVFGVWGVWDYVIAIPRDQELSARLQLIQTSRDALTTEQSRGRLTPEAEAAHAMVLAEMDAVMKRELGRTGSDPIATAADFEEAVKAVREKLQASDDLWWISLLAIIRNGLVAERHLPLTEQEYPEANAAFEQTGVAIEQLDEVTAPGKYDRLTQWAFMLCLPCVPYYLWMYFAARRRVYRLDDEGTLHTPKGSWTRPRIADIDMGRWMAKSIAWVVHTDGTRIKLDDYKFRDLNLIIGAIASRLHPDDWDDEARPVKAESGQPTAETAAAEE
ncbi:MAG: hypothetical protein IID28_02980 [Planctomycetes bacterium]|nr:hypothetical protein [Planctomycetota bacterium]